MPQTIAEKIFSKHGGKEVHAGDFVICDLDLVMAHDTTCSWAVDPFYEIADKVWDKSKIFIPFDHAYPAPTLNMSKLQDKVRKFAKDQGIKVHTEGVCHQLMAERLIKPGDLILGADSHTPTTGAIGAIACGVGSTDAAIAMATGKCWFKVPETIRINIDGKLPEGCYAKDVILMVAKDMGPEGGNYKVLEYGGEVVKNLNITSRLTLTNMSAEMGCKSAVIEPDGKTVEYLEENKRNSTFDENLKSDEGCRYLKIMEYNVDDLEPQIACPHDIDNVFPVREIEEKKVKVDQVFIGSCTNCRIEDLEIVYNMWQDQELNPDTRVIITPASKRVYLQALHRGYIDFFMEKGAVVTNPGCGACLGRNGGVLNEKEVCVSTSNRNFKGRMGSPDAEIYLASPATASATAITGYIADPRKFLKKQPK